MEEAIQDLSGGSIIYVEQFAVKVVYISVQNDLALLTLCLLITCIS